MATVALQKQESRWPSGTTVKAYLESEFPPHWRAGDGVPTGAIVRGSAVVAVDGSLTITGLVGGSRYRLHSDTVDRWARAWLSPPIGAVPRFGALEDGDIPSWDADRGEFVAAPEESEAVPIRIGAGAMSTFSGTPGSANVQNLTVATFPDAATTGLSAAPALVPGVEYDVFFWWSNASGSAGNVRVFYGVEIQSEGVAVPGGSGFLTLSAVATANLPVRTQLPDSVKITGPNQAVAVRVDRRGADALDTLAATMNLHAVELVPRVAVADADIVDGFGPKITKRATPYDGLTPWRAASIYTPLWTTADAVFVAEAVTIGGVEQSRVAKIDKATFATLQDVQLLAAAHDVDPGHRQASVAVDANGLVVTHPEKHHSAWAGKHSTAAGDLSTLTATGTPTGLDTNCSYRRFFRNPYNGDLWMCSRGNAYNAGIYKWDTATKVWAQIGGGFLFDFNGGPYGYEIAFASATTMYVNVEWVNGTAGGAGSGYPRRSAAVLKSVNGGATWTALTGVGIPVPVVVGGEHRHAFPSALSATTVAVVRLAVASDGNPVAVGEWKHPDEAYRSLWVAKWNPTNKDWDRSRLLENLGANNAGNPSLIYTQAGRIIVLVSQIDDHTPGAVTVPPPNNLYLFVSDDAVHWTRYLVGSGSGFSGGYLDGEAYRLDGVIRLLPIIDDSPSVSQIWEFTLPA